MDSSDGPEGETEAQVLGEQASQEDSDAGTIRSSLRLIQVFLPPWLNTQTILTGRLAQVFGAVPAEIGQGRV